jgi:hypothetical protein
VDQTSGNGSIKIHITDANGASRLEGGFSDHTGTGLLPEQTLMPGSYQVKVEFDPMGPEGEPRQGLPRSLFEGSIQVESGETTRVELSAR